MALEVDVEVAEVVLVAREDMAVKEDMAVAKVTEAKEVMAEVKVVMVVALEEDTEMEDTEEAKEDMAEAANNMATKHLSPFGPHLHSEI